MLQVNRCVFRGEAVLPFNLPLFLIKANSQILRNRFIESKVFPVRVDPVMIEKLTLIYLTVERRWRQYLSRLLHLISASLGPIVV